MATQVKESYEELRNKKLEENKKKMEALELRRLSSSLQRASKPPPAKRAKRPAPGTPPIRRRSDRIASLPEPSRHQSEPFRIKRRSDRIAKLPEPSYNEIIDQQLEEIEQEASSDDEMEQEPSSDEESQ